MPRMDTPQPTKALVKLLLIGDGKIGKTHYAGMAAKEGLNVLYLDGDVGAQTIATLPIEARRHIYLMTMTDVVESGQREHIFINVMTDLVNSVALRWDDAQQRVAKRPYTNDIWELRLSKMDNSCVLVIDSWTGLTESIMLKCAIANNVDLSTATTSQMRPVYQSANLIATSFLQVIRSLRCHVIVIAHPDEYVHLTKPTGKTVREAKESDMVIDYTKMIPKTTSKPQGLNMAKYFTDVAWAEIAPNGKERRLDFALKQSRIGGGHFTGSKDADTEHSFANLIRQVGGVIPSEHQPTEPWLKIIPAGEATAPAESKVLDGTTSTPIKGLAGLIKKQSC